SFVLRYFILSLRSVLLLLFSRWTRFKLLSFPASSSPRTRSVLSRDAPSLTERSTRRSHSPLRLDSLSWDSSDSSSSSFISPSTTSSLEHKCHSKSVGNVGIYLFHLLSSTPLIEVPSLRFSSRLL
ncbi:hypothetical protein PRIPAC_76317, partial [Pristionchus pacificus]